MTHKWADAKFNSAHTSTAVAFAGIVGIPTSVSAVVNRVFPPSDINPFDR
jgi:hypothetical protein